MPVTGNIFFSFIVCEHNAQHMIIGHIKIIPLPHLCQRFHFSRAPKAVSSPVEKLSHSLIRLAPTNLVQSDPLMLIVIQKLLKQRPALA